MKFADIIQKVNLNIKRKFRLLEKTKIKIIKKEWSIKYNEICIKEDLLPSYTKLRLHDPAARNTNTTLNYRKYLVERQITNSKQALEKFKPKCDEIIEEINNSTIEENIKSAIEDSLNENLVHAENIVKTQLMKKLNKLYEGEIITKNQENCFINLTNYQPTEEQINFLNLGLNCHIKGKYNKINKVTEIELLYKNLLDLERKEKVIINPSLQDQLKSESTKHRNINKESIITYKMREAANELKNHNNITIKKADKSQTYVIISKIEYEQKIQQIVADETKFKLLKRDPTEKLKKEANDLITTLNATDNSIKIQKIIGDYKPGYLYGTVKVHKNGNPLRPIISQVTTPTYKLAKHLNTIINPYIPNQYMIKSTSDFIDILKIKGNNGIIASLDVESLFTNVPIMETIDIIIQNVYHHQTLRPPKIPEKILRQLLKLCTTQAPFITPNGRLYCQIEGVAMGSPLGPCFANYYMANLENIVLKEIDKKPNIYVRYVDDIFIQVESEEHLKYIKSSFEKSSILKFTHELNIENKLPFLDVLVNNNENIFKTSIYRKNTDKGQCLNADSECATKYKNSVITNYLNRAYKVCSTWQDFTNEVEHIKQLLIDNNYTNKQVDLHVRKFINMKIKRKNNIQKEKKNTINIYYKNNWHTNYKVDERVMKDIIKKNVTSKNKEEKLNLIIFYKNMKTNNLVIKNNPYNALEPLETPNIVYKFKCVSCNDTYIGVTRVSLRKRLNQHSYNGSIKSHYQIKHNKKIEKEELYQNTMILHKENDHQRLLIKECLLILKEKPQINKQDQNFINIISLYNTNASNTI